MINALETKALDLFTRAMSHLANGCRREEGQTSAEYVAVTAVAVAIALGVIYVTLKGALSTAVSNIGAAITSFVSSSV